jgi:DNA-binding NarL/FixJ family response regulator
MQTRICLIDRSALFRDVLRRALPPDLVVVVDADHGTAGRAAIDVHVPDLVIAELSGVGTGGLSLLPELLAAPCRPKLVVLTSAASDTLGPDAIGLGAHGWVRSVESFAALADAIRRVAAGDRRLPTLPDGRTMPLPLQRRREPGLRQLSPREQEIFHLIVKGHSNKDLAIQLGVTVKTIETHRANINRKLQVHSTAQLLRYAIARGLFTPGAPVVDAPSGVDQAAG